MGATLWYPCDSYERERSEPESPLPESFSWRPSR